MKIKISFEEIRGLLEVQAEDFPKYVPAILNLANGIAQGTRPRVVGQMTELIQEFPGKNFEEWSAWYSSRRPEAINEATNRICGMVEKFRQALSQVDRDMVERWVRDLVIVKSFLGLRLQEAILKKIATARKTTWRLANPEEERKGIDGVVGERPHSIKPESYKTKKEQLGETIEAEIVYYRKLRDGIEIEFDSG